MEMERRRKAALAASGGKGVAMTAPGILITIALWEFFPEKMNSYEPLEQNGIFIAIVAGGGYIMAVLKAWAADMLLGSPNNLVYRMLAGGR